AFDSTTTRNQLSTSWSETAGNFSVNGLVSGQLANNANATTGGSSLAVLNLSSTVADAAVEADIDVTATNSYAGLVARYSTANGGTGYYADVTKSGTSLNFRIMKMNNGSFTQLGQTVTITGAASATGTLRLEVFGNSQKLFFDDDKTGSDPSKLVVF